MHERATFVLCGVALLVWLARPAGAQWENLGGPGGCHINGLATSGTYVYAGTEFGIFVSADNGMTWSKAGAIGPAALGQARAWNFMASGTGLFARTARGIYVSWDHAASWAAANRGLPEHPRVTCMAEKEGLLFCGLIRGGIYRSTDRGANWLMAGYGFPDDASVSSLAVVGQDVYAALSESGDFEYGIYRSRDDGTTWVQIESAFPGDASVYFLTAVGRRLLAWSTDGPYLLDEDGRSWTGVRGPWKEDSDVSLLEAADASIIVWVEDGAYLSADGGTTWSELKLVPGQDGSTITCITANGPHLFVGTEEAGLFRSMDLGLTWVPVSADIPSQAQICDIAWMDGDLIAAVKEWGPAEDGIIGENSSRYSGRGAVFIKPGGGTGWEILETGIPKVIYLNCIEAAGPNLLAGTDPGLFISDDRGRTWKPVWPERPIPPSVECLTAMDGRAFAGTDEGIFLSTDGGRTWKAVLQQESGGPRIHSFIQIGSALFAGGAGGIYVSRDRGETWGSAESGLPKGTVCTSLAAAGKRLVAGVYPRERNAPPPVGEGERIDIPYPKFAILVSTDEGRNWKAALEGLPEDFRVSCLTASGSTLVAALEGTYLKMGRHSIGTYLSTDGGASWTGEWPGQWTATPINRFRVDETGVYAATEGAGVWKLPLSALKRAQR